MAEHQHQFILKGLATGCRMSGRTVKERRRPQIAFGPDNGQIEVRLGDTMVLGTTTAEVVIPHPDKPSEGMLSVFTQFSRTAIESGERPSAQHISHLIERLFRGSRVIEPEALCILNGKQVWSLKINLIILSDDGNLTDACGLAALGSLMHFKKQDVTISGQSVIIENEIEREPIRLPLIHHPIMVSHAVIDFATWDMKSKEALSKSLPPGRQIVVVIDPDKIEENLGSSLMTIAANVSGEICLLNKDGGVAIPSDILRSCMSSIHEHVLDISKTLSEALEKGSN